jgi:hypothetical protein
MRLSAEATETPGRLNFYGAAVNTYSRQLATMTSQRLLNNAPSKWVAVLISERKSRLSPAAYGIQDGAQAQFKAPSSPTDT